MQGCKDRRFATVGRALMDTRGLKLLRAAESASLRGLVADCNGGPRKRLGGALTDWRAWEWKVARTSGGLQLWAAAAPPPLGTRASTHGHKPVSSKS